MVPGIILAAGASSRMGRTKALLAADATGTSFVRRLARTLSEGGCEEVIVVTGGESEAILADLERSDLPVRAVVNSRWTDGQLSSLIAALDLIDRPGVRGAAVAVVDAPLVLPATVARLLEVHRRKGALIVRPERAGRHGHPVVFDRSLFGELRRADPRAGARAVLRAHADAIVDVPVDDTGAFDDVDTPEDYAKLRAEAQD
jgi:molybdenum cofactor cytidylyltransferase